MEIELYTGGMAETNAYLLKTDNGNWLIDAPEGAKEFLADAEAPLDGLILTHGHWDHLWDAGPIIESQKCASYGHLDDSKLFEDPNLMASFGLPATLHPVPIQTYLNEGDTLDLGPYHFEILHLPGHCPGSIGLYEKSEGVLFGGDVLFAGGVGRWDLPGGDFKVLMQSIQEKVLTLPDDTVVFSGHGPSTTIKDEKETNPFLNR
jgi:glyoxylase-like metal-dependent hydrolase (beta-lactamase superfamily II)